MAKNILALSAVAKAIAQWRYGIELKARLGEVRGEVGISRFAIHFIRPFLLYVGIRYLSSSAHKSIKTLVVSSF